MNNNQINAVAYNLFNELANAEDGTKQVDLYMAALHNHIDNITNAVKEGLTVSNITEGCVPAPLVNFVRETVAEWIMQSTHFQQDLPVLASNPFGKAKSIDEFNLYAEAIIMHIDQQRHDRMGFFARLKNLVLPDQKLMDQYDSLIQEIYQPKPIETPKTA